MDVTLRSRERIETRLEVPEVDDSTLLKEAMKLTGLERPEEVVRLALKELVERQRFLSWVAAHERATPDRGGNA